MEAHLIHFVATGMGGMLATIALVWKVWVVPAHDREVNLAKWQAGMEARMLERGAGLRGGQGQGRRNHQAPGRHRGAPAAHRDLDGREACEHS